MPEMKLERYLFDKKSGNFTMDNPRPEELPMKYFRCAWPILLSFTLWAMADAALAQDGNKDRQAAADRYLRIVPIGTLIDNMSNEFAMRLPQEKREEFSASMKALVRADALERITRESMVRIFTTEEINALADFYGSSNGMSVMRKFGAYMGEVMPAMLEEFKQAAQQLGAVQGIRDCDICPELLAIPQGSFEMGALEGNDDAKPVQLVTVQRFLLGRTEVTYGQWKALMGSGSGHSACGDACPVSQVSWDDAQLYVKLLGERAGKTYRLPSEAEWEYAARAGQQAKWAFGNDESELDRFAWFANNSPVGARPVRTRQPNALGLFDMHGNVWEWVQDVWHPNYLGAPQDGTAWMQGGDGELRVLRGGAWFDQPASLQSAYRSWNTSSVHYYGAGLRVARNPD